MALPQLACHASIERFLRTCASQVKRQHETEFIDMLQQVRYGENLDNVLRVLAKHCSTELSDLDGVDITRIYATNEPADKHNQQRLDDTLPEMPAAVFTSVDSSACTALGECPLLAVVKLKPGALVVCVLNDKALGIVNGERGTVQSVKADSVVVVFESAGSRTVTRRTWTTADGLSRSQLPLRLAWALTVHRCQGMVGPTHTSPSYGYVTPLTYKGLRCERRRWRRCTSTWTACSRTARRTQRCHAQQAYKGYLSNLRGCGHGLPTPEPS